MIKTRLKYTYLIGASLVWVYLICRAWFIPPVHDEAATFFHYVNHNQFIPGKALWDANNHLLNTFLSIVFVKIFGVSTFTIRLASLLSFPLYAWFTYRLASQLGQWRMQVLLLLTGLTMHGFIEYMAYSRGYGMSMALLTGALYYSYKFFKQKNIHLLIPAFFLYFIATSANLTLQNSALLFLGFASIYLLVEKFSLRDRIMASAYIITGFLFMLFFVNLSLKMKADGLLYYADRENFWTAVIVSFTQMFFAEKNSLLLNIFWVVWCAILIYLCVAALHKGGINWTTNRCRLFFPAMFFASLAGILAMHFILGVNYPSDRTGMYLILYLSISTFFIADTLKSNGHHIVAAIPTGIFFIHFVISANISHSSYWKNEHIPVRFWERISDESKTGKYLDNPTVGGYQIRNLIWAWYNFTHHQKLQNLQYTNYYSGFEDYQIFSEGDFGLHKNEYDSLDFDNISKLTLARRKTFIQTQILIDSTDIYSSVDYAGEYFNLYETFNTDSLVGNSLLVESTIKLYSLKTPPKIHLVVGCMDSAGTVLDYQSSPLDWIKKEYRPEDEGIQIKCWVYKVPVETKRFIIYLWNVDKEKYTLEKSSVSINKIIR